MKNYQNSSNKMFKFQFQQIVPFHLRIKTFNFYEKLLYFGNVGQENQLFSGPSPIKFVQSIKAITIIAKTAPDNRIVFRVKKYETYIFCLVGAGCFLLSTGTARIWLVSKVLLRSTTCKKQFCFTMENIEKIMEISFPLKGHFWA